MEKFLGKMVHNESNQHRNTGLKYRLLKVASFFADDNKKDDDETKALEEMFKPQSLVVSKHQIKGPRISAVVEIPREIESLAKLQKPHKNTCDFCLDRFGVVQRMSQWIQDGLPGADVCAGGDLCKCGLVAA